MVLYHGSRQIVKEPEIRIARYNKDFVMAARALLINMNIYRILI